VSLLVSWPPDKWSSSWVRDLVEVRVGRRGDCLLQLLSFVLRISLGNLLHFVSFVSSFWLYVYYIDTSWYTWLCHPVFCSPRQPVVRCSAAQIPDGKIRVWTPSFPSSAILLFVQPWGLSSTNFKLLIQMKEQWINKCDYLIHGISYRELF